MPDIYNEQVLSSFTKIRSMTDRRLGSVTYINVITVCLVKIEKKKKKKMNLIERYETQILRLHILYNYFVNNSDEEIIFPNFYYPDDYKILILLTSDLYRDHSFS